MNKNNVVGQDLKPDWMVKFGSIMAEIWNQLIRGLKEPGKGLYLSHLQSLVEHTNPFFDKRIRVRFDATFDEKTWTIIEDVPFDGEKFSPELVKFLESDERDTNGEMMRLRAKKLGVKLPGLKHARYLLENQELIPQKWGDKFYLFFPGTLVMDPEGHLFVPYLGSDYDDGGYFWALNFSWLGDDDLGSRERIVIPKGC